MAASPPPTNVNPYDPIEVARANPYFKRNHMGQVTCTLCGIYCPEENNFLKHVAGKTHSLELQKRQNMELRHQRQIVEDRRNTEAEERARKEEALLALSTNQSGGNSSGPAAAGAPPPASAVSKARFGTPLYSFRTEHDEVLFRTKVWVEVLYGQAEEGTRPLHRWLSAREQHVEKPADDYFVYLLFACGGYETIALKFPAAANRTGEGDALIEADGTSSDAFLCTWDSLRKVYSLFFVISR